MTENEAKTKQCPLVVDCGGALGFPNPTNCRASGCMMWRWDTYEGPPPGAVPGQLYPTYKHLSDTDGHCGLAR